MKQVHALSVLAVFLLIWAVAFALASGPAASTAEIAAFIGHWVVWLVAGGVAVLGGGAEAFRLRLRPALR